MNRFLGYTWIFIFLNYLSLYKHTVPTIVLNLMLWYAVIMNVEPLELLICTQFYLLRLVKSYLEATDNLVNYPVIPIKTPSYYLLPIILCLLYNIKNTASLSLKIYSMLKICIELKHHWSVFLLNLLHLPKISSTHAEHTSKIFCNIPYLLEVR